MVFDYTHVHPSSKNTTVTLRYLPGHHNQVGEYCCWAYEINIKDKGRLSVSDLEWGIHLQNHIFVADPTNVDVDQVCSPNNSIYKYERGGDDEPTVIMKKKSGDSKFNLQFVSKCDSTTNAGIVLVVKDNGKWYRVNYEGQYGLPGPKQEKPF